MSIYGIGAGSSNLVGVLALQRQDSQILDGAAQAGDSSIRAAATASGAISQGLAVRSGLTAMLSTLNSGEATAAQSTFGSYQQEGDSQESSDIASSQSTFINSLNSLIEAVQSGNLSGAQAAVAALLGSSSGSGALGQASLSATGAFAGLIGAVQAGDINGARSTLSSTPEDLEPQASSAPAKDGSDSSASFQGALTDLVSAVQSGDLASAQKAASTLQGDSTSAEVNGRLYRYYWRAQDAPPGGSNSSAAPSSGSTSYGTDDTDSELISIL